MLLFFGFVIIYYHYLPQLLIYSGLALLGAQMYAVLCKNPNGLWEVEADSFSSFGEGALYKSIREKQDPECVFMVVSTTEGNQDPGEHPVPFFFG